MTEVDQWMLLAECFVDTVSTKSLQQVQTPVMLAFRRFGFGNDLTPSLWNLYREMVLHRGVTAAQFRETLPPIRVTNTLINLIDSTYATVGSHAYDFYLT